MKIQIEPSSPDYIEFLQSNGNSHCIHVKRFMDQENLKELRTFPWFNPEAEKEVMTLLKMRVTWKKRWNDPE